MREQRRINPFKRGNGPRRQRTRRQRLLRHVTRFSLATGCVGVVALTAPLIAHGQVSTLASYGVDASGAAITPYLESDQYQSIPVTDESAPYIYVNISGSQDSASADAVASYLHPSTLVNAGLNTNNVNAQPPTGVASDVEARYPGNGSQSTQVGVFSDGVANQGSAGIQSAQANETQSQAEAQVVGYQFIPPSGAPSSPVPVPPLPTGLPPLPTLPPLPGVTPLPTSSPSGGPGGSGGSGGSSPTATPTSTGGSGGSGGATPTPTPCATIAIIGGCVPGTETRHVPTKAHVETPILPLPDIFEQRLSLALQAIEGANPGLLQLANGKLPNPNAGLAFASAADVSSEGITQVSDSGVGVAIQTHAGQIEVFQGLITIQSMQSTLRANVPADGSNGTGTITTQVSGATIAGIPVTIDANGVQINCPTSGSIPAPCAGSGSGQTIKQLSQQLNTALAASGISITTDPSTITPAPGKWDGTGGAVQISGTLSSTPTQPSLPGGVTLPTLPQPPSVPGLPGIPSTPAIGATHVNYELGQVVASLYAAPAAFTASGGGNGGFGFPGNPGLPGFISTVFGSPGGSSNGSSGRGQSGRGIFSVPYALTPGELLAILLIVEGFSTAAVAAAASNAETGDKLQRSLSTLIEEESR